MTLSIINSQIDKEAMQIVSDDLSFILTQSFVNSINSSSSPIEKLQNLTSSFVINPNIPNESSDYSA